MVKKEIKHDKAIKSDLDSLFKKKKKTIEKKPEVKKPETKKAEKAEKPKKERQPKEKGARFTEEGFRIYSTEELNIGKGGDTADCPIDCNCCF